MRRFLDGQTLFLLVLLLALAAAAWWKGGPELVRRGLGSGGSLLVRFALVIVISFLAAGLAEVLVPHEWVRGRLGADSGLRGILVASLAGVLTPAGPFVSMPVAAVMIRAGAGAGPVVAFLTGWALLALHRLLAWEVPILGWRMALLRYAISLLVPVAAGLAARALLRA